MNKSSWRKVVLSSVNDDIQLDLLAEYLHEADEAKQALRERGYGCLGMGLLETIEKEVPPVSYESDSQT